MQFIDLVNDVCRHFNDVELSSSNFNTAVGFQAFVEDAVNYSIRQIHEGETEWPFNYDTWTETLTPLQQKYGLPPDAARVRWNTFRIERNDALQCQGDKLNYIELEDYMNSWYPQDIADDIGGVPQRIFRYLDLSWGCSKKPDKAYQITYDYWKQPLKLQNYNDITTIPDRFEHVVVNGAIAQCYRFRQNKAAADDYQNQYEQGVKMMRTQLINRYDYITDTRAPGN